MKYLSLLFFMTLINYEHKKNTIRVKKYISETTAIMKSLDIDVRDSIKQDGQLLFQIIDSIKNPTYSGSAGVFNNTSAGRVVDSIGNLVKYKTPIIFLSVEVDSILRERANKSRFAEVYASSIIVHELTHYLQKTLSKRYGKLSFEELYRLPSEQEAYTVQAYYFIKHYSPNTIKKYVSGNKNSLQYRIDIFNEMIKLYKTDSSFGMKLIEN